MTRDEILALEGSDLDVAVGRLVMGLSIDRAGDMDCYLTDGRWRLIPQYSSSPSAARLVLAEVERRGPWKEYVGCITDMLETTGYWDELCLEDAVKLLTATPAQICRAALLAVEGV